MQQKGPNLEHCCNVSRNSFLEIADGKKKMENLKLKVFCLSRFSNVSAHISFKSQIKKQGYEYNHTICFHRKYILESHTHNSFGLHFKTLGNALLERKSRFLATLMEWNLWLQWAYIQLGVSRLDLRICSNRLFTRSLWFSIPSRTERLTCSLCLPQSTGMRFLQFMKWMHQVLFFF